ncbi:hypothetical protein [uncultured Xanthomonas sp.]|uniref:hypothetical protein n=1 Tax=Xanthomonas sontii TaxID=2650745 RepID=UPI0025CB9709|nr:hypothetical protein [uncultured Xanthomonas sp.]
MPVDIARVCVQLALRDSQAQRTVTPAQRDLLDILYYPNEHHAQQGHVRPSLLPQPLINQEKAI